MAEDEKKRTNIEDLPKAEEELTADEAKNVHGGDSFYGTGVYKSTDSGRSSTGNTVGGTSSNNSVGSSGRIGSVAVDPSDPSGNT